METAKIISSKSPVGIYALKQVMRRELKKKAEEGMEYIAQVNANMLQTKDMMTAISAWITK